MSNILILLIICIVVYLLSATAYWGIFQKAGEVGWKGLIPLYNTYIVFKLAWKTAVFWILVILAVLAGFCNLGEPGTISTLGSFLSFACFIIYCMCMSNLSKVFGHGGGFTAGLILLPLIFLLILAFGNSQYLGNPYSRNRIS